MRIFLLVLIFWSGRATAILPEQIPTLGGGQTLFQSDFDLRNDTYQIGEEWGKTPVTPDKIGHSEVFRRTAGATARVSGATGFYLGEFNGVHIVATNSHVCPRMRSCQWGSVRLPQLGTSYRPLGLIGTWPEIDLAFLKIDAPAGDVQLKSVARNFSFSAPVYPGQKLLTIGFGTANNRRRNMMMNADNDCKTFSGRNEFRKMADPDSLNRGRHRVWSFANGCDVSHGDSGSAMVDRKTGDIVGIIWTGKIPKNARVRNSRYLDDILESQAEDVWQELSYAVPAAKMKDVLIEKLNAGRILPKTE